MLGDARDTGPDIRVDDVTGSAVRSLIAAHLRGMHATSPPESVHALGLEALRDPSVTVWSAWHGNELAGVAALRTLDARRGEIKSMRVVEDFLGSGIGRALLRHVVAEARTRGMHTLLLETGASEDFEPARRLYASEGFAPCGPFGDYSPDPFSVFMSRSV
jgi:putative acetyltransferase